MFSTFFQNFDEFSRYLTSKYISKSNCVLHVGEFYKKIHFFGSRFFKFHRHVIHFWSKKRGKKRLPVVIFIKKISRKNQNRRKNLTHFPNMWHDLDIKNTLIFKNLHMGDPTRNIKKKYENVHFWASKSPYLTRNSLSYQHFFGQCYIWEILRKMM